MFLLDILNFYEREHIHRNLSKASYSASCRRRAIVQLKTFTVHVNPSFLKLCDFQNRIISNKITDTTRKCLCLHKYECLFFGGGIYVIFLSIESTYITPLFFLNFILHAPAMTLNRSFFFSTP